MPPGSEFSYPFGNGTFETNPFFWKQFRKWGGQFRFIYGQTIGSEPIEISGHPLSLALFTPLLHAPQ